MIAPGTALVLEIEKPAAGGRMIARHAGEVVLVHGAIPGERVRAIVEPSTRSVALARTAEVLTPHAARRPVATDPACGGNDYLHIAYDHQLSLKASIVADAFSRIGRMPLGAPVAVAASPEAGYRMRARLHARGGRIGYFREGSHDLCDPAGSGHLLPDACVVAARLAELAPEYDLAGLDTIDVVENLPGTERVLHFGWVRGAAPDAAFNGAVTGLPHASGASWSAGSGASHVVSGRPVVSDPLSAFVPASSVAGATLERHGRAFFQANRFLVGRLVQRVVDLVLETPVVDLYAGVGLFACALAAAGRSGVTAVEGDVIGAEDLKRNARQFGGAAVARQVPVERFLADRQAPRARTLIVDPPRTGMSREAMRGVIESEALRIVYVSCDTATLARDARRLVDAGYALSSIECLDLFPNTPHVESVCVFDHP
jgi:23S rRNA (uracil1939-C5)-methyltransferase